METFAGIIALVLLLICLWVAGSGCTCRNAPATPPAVVVSAEGMKSLDRAAIRAMLKRVADTPPPIKDIVGAMCYEPTMSAARADYVCPKCGERTLYEESDGKQGMHGIADVVHTEIPACRREYEGLRKVAGDAAVLDESQFCRKCRPNVTEPKLLLHIGYKDGKPRDVENIHAEDLRIIREFLAGELMHKQNNDGETSLKNSLPRLQELLGVKLDER